MSEPEAEYNVGDPEQTRDKWETLATFGRSIPDRAHFEALAEKSGRTWQQELVKWVMERDGVNGE